MLDDLRIERYARHILLREVGGVGQDRILSSKVEIRGLGEAGCWATTYLALAGVGRLRLCDPRPIPAGGLGPLLLAAAEGEPRDRAAAKAIGGLNLDVVVEVGGGAASAPGAWTADGRGESVRIRVAPSAPTSDPSATGAYFVATRDGRAVGGWEGGRVCEACLEAALGSAPSGPSAAALAGSTAASEVLAAILQEAPRPRGLRIHRLGEPLPVGPCPHGDAA
ncbi:MAG TPA: ThiF family adenylyltransferase [Vulgatibacter sp.]|nr:ThiF family adenylyltransferase [Vulgatibacter sp.]